MIELRSDTFTLPTQAMLEAMVSAPLGDDVYGEDPTVNRLERMAAERLGKAAACLMPSGTMANLTSLMAHAPRGSKVLIGAESDAYLFEARGATVCGGIAYEPIVNAADGTLPLDALRAAFPDDPDDPQYAPPAVICLENSQNRCGGLVLSDEYQASVAELAKQHGVAVHLDGARVFNAAVARGVPPAQIAQHADSVQFCLSKGLSAPIGSIAVGGEEFISRVRRHRKMLGGGMRQAGVVAAAGIVALDEMVDRLIDDHHHARRLADGLRQIPGVTLAAEPQTNIVVFRVAGLTPAAFVKLAADVGVGLIEFGHGRVRAVCHSGITAAMIDQALELIAGALRSSGSADRA